MGSPQTYLAQVCFSYHISHLLFDAFCVRRDVICFLFSVVFLLVVYMQMKFAIFTFLWIFEVKYIWHLLCL